MITPYLFPSKKSPNPGVNKAEKKPAGVSKLQIFNRPSLPLTAPLVCFLSFFVFQNSLTHRGTDGHGTGAHWPTKHR